MSVVKMVDKLRALTRVASVRKQYRDTPYFLETHYLEQIQSGKPWAPMVHFHDVGWRQKLNPSPFFDVAFYLAANKDVRRAEINPLIHYIDYGWKEGRSPHPSFDLPAFLWAHPDIDPQHSDPAAECIRLYGTLSWRKSSVTEKDQKATSAAERPAAPVPVSVDHPGPSLSPPVQRLELDELRGNHVSGWAWSSAAEEGLAVELWCGGIRLGHVLRHINRPDVDRQLEGASGTKGFLLPAGCLNALSQLMGAAGGALEPTIRFGGEVRSLLTTNPLLGDLASFRTLRAATAKQGWRVEDLWWANSRLLKLRMNNRPGEAGEPTATLLRLFQPLPQPAGQPRLALVDELAIAAGASIASVGVRNPLLPLLFVGCDETGEILFTDLVPFPSLLRGGLHEAEAAVVGEQGGTLEDVCRLNDAYLAEAAGWGEAEPAGTIGEIEIDLLAATGAEPIFDPAVGAWLSSFNVALGGANDERRVERDLGDRSFVDHAQVQLARHRPARPRAGCARLCLPSRALPTIGAVVSRRLPVPAARRPGPHIVVDEAFPHRRCLVAFPGGVPQSLYSGPQARLGEMPHLVLLAEPSAEGGGGGEANPVGDHLQPIAILFHELAPKDEALKVFPVPKDQADILPAGAASARVSVISTVLRPNLDVRMLLGTLASQLTGADCELILAVANHHASQLGQLRAALEEALPGRGQVIEVAEALNTSAALNRAALAATGEVLLLVDSSVILHDRRTVETLGRLALREGIGTAGCLQLKSRRAADGVPVFASAGYFPARIDFAIAPHLGLSELDCSEILPRAVYPVAANSGRCLAVAADRWRQAGGLSQRLPNSLADIDLAVRLADAGYTNVCTTLISVEVDNSHNAKKFIDTLAPASANLQRVLPAVATSTLLRLV